MKISKTMVKNIKFQTLILLKNLKQRKKVFLKKINFKHNNLLLNKITTQKSKKTFLGVSINSKSIKKGNLFVAIKGRNKDGHKFIKEAILKGALNCILSKHTTKIPKNKIIKVPSTLNFLNKLADVKRNNSQAEIIAVTGSSGKTSVKDLIGNLLQKYNKTYFSPRSFNNSYGVLLAM